MSDKETVEQLRAELANACAERDALAKERDGLEAEGLKRQLAETEAKVERLRRKLHDERVRRNAWEKMYDQAIAGTEVEQLQADLAAEHALMIMYSDRGAAIRRKLQEAGAIAPHEEITNLDAITRLGQLQERLRQVKTSLDHEVDSRVRAELEVKQLQAGLEQTRFQLSQLAGAEASFMESTARAQKAGREQSKVVAEVERLRRQLKHIESERDKLRSELARVNIKLNRVCRDARDWLDPAEAEGLRQQLAVAENCREYWFKAHGEMIALTVDAENKRNEWHRECKHNDKRLEKLDAAEAALAECGIGGVYTEFDGLTDAITQMTEYIGDPERCMRQEAERRNAQLKKHLADARRVAGLWYNRAKAKPVEAEELAATAQREEELIRIRWALRDVRSANRSLAQQLTDRTSNRDYWHDTCLAAEKERTEIRQEAQAQSDEVQAHWLSPCEAEELRRQLAQAVVAQADAELIAHDRDKICYEERRLRLEAEQGHRGALTMAQNRAIRLEQAEHRVEIMAVRARRNQFNTPTSAEALSADRQALAALVTPELAELLERLARYVDTWGDWDTCNADTDAAHDLAAQIRETLEVNDEN